MVDIEDQKLGIAVLAQFAIDIGTDRQLWRISDLIRGHDTWTHWQKSVQALAKIPLFVTGLHVSGADIIDHGVTENVVLGLFLGYAVSVLADDHSQLGLVIQALYQVRVSRNALLVANCLIDTFGEIDRIWTIAAKRLFLIAGGFLRMSHIVDAQTDHILLRF